MPPGHAVAVVQRIRRCNAERAPPQAVRRWPSRDTKRVVSRAGPPPACGNNAPSTRHDPQRPLTPPPMISASTRLALGYTAMLTHGVMHAARLREAAVREALARQIHLSGVQALPAVSLIAALLGAVVPTQAMALLGTDNESVLKILVWGGIRELAPLIAALVLTARSGVAIATEVALMHLRSGMDESLWHGAAHEDEVVIPRMLGLAVCGALLVSYFQTIAIAAALLASSLLLDTPLLAELDTFLVSGVWWQVLAAIGKGTLFGLAIGAVCCYHGLNAEPKVAAVPKAAVAAGLGSLAAVLAIDLFAAGLRFV